MPVRQQRDLTNDGCYNGAAQSKVTLKQFRELICDHCHNPECMHAKWGMTPFDLRVQTWQERLFGERREVSDLTLPRHLQIHQNEFPDATAKALKLIVSAAKNDWSYIPDDDGTRVAEPSTTSKVDDAVKKLAEKRGQKAPEPPPSEVEPNPEEELARETEETVERLEEEADEELVIPGDEEPVEEPEPEPEPAPEGWTEEELERARRKDAEAGVGSRPPPSTTMGNTPMPAAGIMVDGKPPDPRAPKAPVHDPWAPRKDKVVEPGTKVVLGGGKKDDDDGKS